MRRGRRQSVEGRGALFPESGPGCQDLVFVGSGAHEQGNDEASERRIHCRPEKWQTSTIRPRVVERADPGADPGASLPVVMVRCDAQYKIPLRPGASQSGCCRRWVVVGGWFTVNVKGGRGGKAEKIRGPFGHHIEDRQQKLCL